MAQVLELPHDGSRTLRIGGPAATSWLTALAKRVADPPKDADWAVGACMVGAGAVGAWAAGVAAVGAGAVGAVAAGATGHERLRRH